jgi:protein involved in polysaccharide export with SLBB domain
MRTQHQCQGTAWLVMLALGAAAGCHSSLPARAPVVAPYRPMERPDVPRPGLARVDDVVLRAVRPAASNEMEVVSNEGRTLKSGDRLQVTIYAPPEPSSFPHVVDEQGNINLPLIGAFRVAGRTCGEAQDLIEKSYIERKYYKTITVIIVPPESEYSVTGEMMRPGPYPLTRNLTLTMALGRAGRYTEYADQRRVILTRNNQRVEINLEEIRSGKRKDIIVIPGDVIEVPRSAW